MKNGSDKNVKIFSTFARRLFNLELPSREKSSVYQSNKNFLKWKKQYSYYSVKGIIPKTVNNI